MRQPGAYVGYVCRFAFGSMALATCRSLVGCVVVVGRGVSRLGNDGVLDEGH